MVESFTLCAAAVDATPVQNEWPEYLGGSMPAADNVKRRRSTSWLLVRG